jgi:hypothetical protein
MKPYTVVLLYPDYIAAQYCETRVDFALGDTPELAIAAAQVAAAGEFGEPSVEPDDFAVVACFEGHLQDVQGGA